MTLREILNEAILNADIPISDKDFISRFNSAQNHLAMLYDTAKKCKEQIIHCKNIDVLYPLNDSIGIRRVLIGNQVITNYKVYEGKLLFIEKGDYIVQYYTFYELIRTMNDTPEIPIPYLLPIAKFVAAKMVSNVNNEKSKELMSEFAEDSSLANTLLRSNTNKNKRAAVSLFR